MYRAARACREDKLVAVNHEKPFRLPLGGGRYFAVARYPGGIIQNYKM